MGNATVINSREGNDVTVDNQFSQRKLAFITHLILQSKQVSSVRLSRGIWQLLLQKPSSWCGEEKEISEINGKGRVGGEGRKHITQKYIFLCCMAAPLSKCCLSINMPVNGEMWLFDAFWHPASAHDSNTFTSSVFFLCPISFSMEVSRKTRGYNKWQRGEVGQPRAAAPLYRGRSGRRLKQSFRLTWTFRQGHRLRASYGTLVFFFLFFFYEFMASCQENNCSWKYTR